MNVVDWLIFLRKHVRIWNNTSQIVRKFIIVLGIKDNRVKINMLITMSSLNLLTPPTTPEDECASPQFPSLVVFDSYESISFRGGKNKESILVKVNDLLTYFKLNVDYMRTVSQYIVAYSLQDLYAQDFYNITGAGGNRDVFSEYTKSYELYIKYKGIDILAHNISKLTPFRDWLNSMMDDLECYEEIDYDSLGW
jgi:hypothetical protein